MMKIEVCFFLFQNLLYDYEVHFTSCSNEYDMSCNIIK